MSDLNLSSPTPTTTSPQPATSPSEVSELRAQIQTLRIALLIVAASLAAFLFLEARRAGKALIALRPQAAQVDDANKSVEPAVNRFVSQLADFTKTHPDFGAVLGKYIGRSAGAPAAAPTAAPAPAPAAVKPAAAPAPVKK